MGGYKSVTIPKQKCVFCVTFHYQQITLKNGAVTDTHIFSQLLGTDFPTGDGKRKKLTFVEQPKIFFNNRFNKHLQ